MKTIATAALALGLIGGAAMAASETEDVRLLAAGSLRDVMTDIAAEFSAGTGIAVSADYGPSGLLRERIEGGEAAGVFASANMEHPETLSEAGLAGEVVMFARNRLCAIAQDDVEVTSETLLAVMLDKGTRLGTSTPGADPSGDYAWALFARAEQVEPGAEAALAAKALQLTGGPDSAPAPEGRNTYAWVMDEDRADLFLTYCTNAILAAREKPGLQIVQLPEALSVGADYGLAVLTGAPETAIAFAGYILSPEGQDILAAHGFSAPGTESGVSE
ncbi:molybdate ABC transporter substrate-binding protein [Pontibaca methylaminivorans]|uniref:molybdate ABC transporter substrate-binding protein n=1 Tax=Pontibaca methylaminivorans TaxID=515897 RepID=UPI002FDA89C4